jgi:hypothetical protein
MIGGDEDLDLLSLFPQEDARIMGGMGRYKALRRSTMEGKNELKRLGVIEEEAPIK